MTHPGKCCKLGKFKQLVAEMGKCLGGPSIPQQAHILQHAASFF